MVRGAKKVAATRSYEEHLTEILAWGVETCRFLTTKSRMYRNIILGAHLIIYRINADSIEVLDIIHSASSIRKIRSVRGIRL